MTLMITPILSLKMIRYTVLFEKMSFIGTYYSILNAPDYFSTNLISYHTITMELT